MRNNQQDVIYKTCRQVYKILCQVYKTHCQVYKTHCKKYKLHCKKHKTHCHVYRAHCQVYKTHCQVYKTHCKKYKTHCKVYKTHCQAPQLAWHLLRPLWCSSVAKWACTSCAKQQAGWCVTGELGYLEVSCIPRLTKVSKQIPWFQVFILISSVEQNMFWEGCHCIFKGFHCMHHKLCPSLVQPAETFHGTTTL